MVFKNEEWGIEHGKFSQLSYKNNISPMKVSASIINYAENTSIDLIVVGTRGRSGFKRLLITLCPLSCIGIGSHVVG